MPIGNENLAFSSRHSVDHEGVDAGKEMFVCIGVAAQGLIDLIGFYLVFVWFLIDCYANYPFQCSAEPGQDRSRAYDESLEIQIVIKYCC